MALENQHELEVLVESESGEERVEYDGDNSGDVDNDEGWQDEAAELTAEEREELEQAMMPIKLALVNVRALLMLSYLHKLISSGPAPQTCVQGQTLLHHPSPGVENHSWGAQAVHHAHSMGHRNPVEFDIQHAGVHPATS